MDLEEKINKLKEKTVETLKQLEKIWSDMGVDEESRNSRNLMVFTHVESLYRDMIAEAEESKACLIQNIESIYQKIRQIGKDLRMEIILEDNFENVPLEKVEKLVTNKLQGYREIYTNRMNEIKDFIDREKILCHALGKKPNGLVLSPLPSREELNNFQNYLEQLSDLKFRREEHFLKRKAQITEIIKELQIRPCLEFEKTVVYSEDSAFKVSDENMVRLDEFHQAVADQLEETKVAINELRERITTLWERLEESPQVRSAFLEANQGNSVKTMLVLKNERHRLEERKKANIKLVIDRMRQELLGWWTKCYTSGQERAQFTHFNSDFYTEDLLTFHEMEVEKLKSHYETNISLYKLYQKHLSLWEQMIDLEDRENEPDRYKNRGGQLLNEEKKRKAIVVQLPKIEHEIDVLLEQYEKDNTRPFLVNGRPLKEVITEAWTQHKEKKKVKLSAKKKLREQIVTPCKSPYPKSSSSRLVLTSSQHKRKCDTPILVHSTAKKSRLDTESIGSTKSASGRLQLATLGEAKKMTNDKQQRLEKIRKRTRLQQSNDTYGTTTNTTNNYDLFANELEKKPFCRSSLFPDRVLRSNTLQPTNITNSTRSAVSVSNTPRPLSTPRKAFGAVNNTPKRSTPMHLRNRTKQLSALTNNLPIII